MRQREIVLVENRGYDTEGLQRELWKQGVAVLVLNFFSLEARELLRGVPNLPKSHRTDSFLVLVDENREAIACSDTNPNAEEIRRMVLLRESHYDPREGRGNFVPRIDTEEIEELAIARQFPVALPIVERRVPHLNGYPIATVGVVCPAEPAVVTGAPVTFGTGSEVRLDLEAERRRWSPGDARHMRNSDE